MGSKERVVKSRSEKGQQVEGVTERAPPGAFASGRVGEHEPSRAQSQPQPQPKPQLTPAKPGSAKPSPALPSRA